MFIQPAPQKNHIHNNHLPTLTTPLPTPSPTLAIITTNQTYHINPTSAHSTANHPALLTHRNLLLLLLNIFSIKSTTLFTFSLCPVTKSVYASSASSAAFLVRSVKSPASVPLSCSTRFSNRGAVSPANLSDELCHF